MPSLARLRPPKLLTRGLSRFKANLQFSQMSHLRLLPHCRSTMSYEREFKAQSKNTISVSPLVCWNPEFRANWGIGTYSCQRKPFETLRVPIARTRAAIESLLPKFSSFLALLEYATSDDRGLGNYLKATFPSTTKSACQKQLPRFPSTKPR